MAAMYSVYHGPSGLKNIASQVHAFTQVLKTALENFGYSIENASAYFDTLTVNVKDLAEEERVHGIAEDLGINFRKINNHSVGVTLDESVSSVDLVDIINVFALASGAKIIDVTQLVPPPDFTPDIPSHLQRQSKFLEHPIFNTHHSETEMLRYMYSLQEKDLSLVHAMIPLGSCTMKLNSTSSMIPLTWPEFSTIHPFVPQYQAQGYSQIIRVSSYLQQRAFCVDYKPTHRNWRVTCVK